MSDMDIVCKRCGLGVAADDVNLDHMIAKCRRCNAVFDVSRRADDARARPRRLIGMPAHLRVLVDERDVTGEGDYRHAPIAKTATFAVLRRWFEPRKHLPLLFFLVLWDGFLIAMYWNTLRSPSPVDTGTLLFPILHVAAGLFLTYSVVAGFFNTTRVAIEQDELVIRHRPIPWVGNRNIPTQAIEQLFAEEKVSRSSRSTSVSYDLSAILVSGQRVKLLGGLSTVDQALFIEQAIEERLGLADVAVAGEVPR